MTKKMKNDLFFEMLERLNKKDSEILEALEDQLADYENDDPKYKVLLDIEFKCFEMGLSAAKFIM